jgi:hypothetical protein
MHFHAKSVQSVAPRNEEAPAEIPGGFAWWVTLAHMTTYEPCAFREAGNIDAAIARGFLEDLFNQV